MMNIKVAYLIISKNRDARSTGTKKNPTTDWEISNQNRYVIYFITNL